MTIRVLFIVQIISLSSIFIVFVQTSTLISFNNTNTINTTLNNRLTEIIGKIIRYVPQPPSRFRSGPSTSSTIIALENEKTLAILEIRNGDSTLIDCILFDLSKRGDVGRRFLEHFSMMSRNRFSHYLIDYNILLMINELCRLFTRQQMHLSDNNTCSNCNNTTSNVDNHIAFNEQINNLIAKISRVTNWIAPGTLWCGAGDIANEYWDLGLAADVDMCCREHDHCPIRLAANEENYGLRNEQRTTLSYCQCDRNFFDCLEQTGSFYGEKIKWIYFNLLQLQCLEPVTCFSRWIWTNGRWNWAQRKSEQYCENKFRLTTFQYRNDSQ